jgi:serine/threonine protein kinase
MSHTPTIPWAVGGTGPGQPGTTLELVSVYEILEELGKGGMGVVYKALQKGLNRLVALKTIRAEQADSEILARFRAEAEAVARLCHPNIVQIYEIGEHEGIPFFAMEWVKGGSLDRRLAGTPQPVAASVRLVEPLARAMHCAHRAGIVHRDLKPANILLDGDPNTPLDECVPKVTDFGIAKWLFHDRGLTRNGQLLGSLRHMAPEQLRRKSEIGPATDVYGLGAILYELLTGRPPFRCLSLPGLLDRVRRKQPVPPQRLRPDLPATLDAICTKCLAKSPGDRYASAEELADVLHRFLAEEVT